MQMHDKWWTRGNKVHMKALLANQNGTADRFLIITLAALFGSSARGLLDRLDERFPNYKTFQESTASKGRGTMNLSRHKSSHRSGVEVCRSGDPVQM
ncbi:hypothetical protein TNCV_3892981 [Trichonephila clavipes]|nr:hypothetical protein TNCV_3892981 [Trichonephila clavipes]